MMSYYIGDMQANASNLWSDLYHFDKTVRFRTRTLAVNVPMHLTYGMVTGYLQPGGVDSLELFAVTDGNWNTPQYA